MKNMFASLLGLLLAVPVFAAEGTLGTNPDMPDAPTWTGTRIGHNARIANGVKGAICIADGSTNSSSVVTADQGVQIGSGSNATAKTVQFFSREVLDANGNIPLTVMTNALFTSGFTNNTYPNVAITALTNALQVNAIRVGSLFSDGNVMITGMVTTTKGAIIGDAATNSGTLKVVGAATFTAVPTFSGALTADGALTNGPTTVLPTGAGTNGFWMSFKHGSSNIIIRAYTMP